MIANFKNKTIHVDLKNKKKENNKSIPSNVPTFYSVFC